MNSYHDEYKLITNKIKLLLALQLFAYFWIGISFFYHVSFAGVPIFESYKLTISKFISFWEILLISLIFFTHQFVIILLAHITLKRIWEVEDLNFRDTLGNGEHALWGTQIFGGVFTVISIFVIFNPVAFLNVFLVVFLFVANLFLMVINLFTAKVVRINWKFKKSGIELQNLVVQSMAREVEELVEQEVQKENEERQKSKFKIPFAKKKKKEPEEEYEVVIRDKSEVEKNKKKGAQSLEAYKEQLAQENEKKRAEQDKNEETSEEK